MGTREPLALHNGATLVEVNQMEGVLAMSTPTVAMAAALALALRIMAFGRLLLFSLSRGDGQHPAVAEWNKSHTGGLAVLGPHA
ncbi:MAG TPA: hypothetical protein VHI72_10315 [Hyphomicrobiaceae bacterium]|nr:hypothetical protein [Hyphomicrobiaceae bacterium]